MNNFKLKNAIKDPHDNCQNRRFWNQDSSETIMKFYKIFSPKDTLNPLL